MSLRLLPVSALLVIIVASCGGGGYVTITDALGVANYTLPTGK